MFLNLKRIEYLNYKKSLYNKIQIFNYINNYYTFKLNLFKSKYCLFIFLGFYKNLRVFKDTLSFYNLSSKKNLNFFNNDFGLKLIAYTDKFDLVYLFLKKIGLECFGFCINVIKLKSNFVIFGFLLKLLEEKVLRFFYIKSIFRIYLIFKKYIVGLYNYLSICQR